MGSRRITKTEVAVIRAASACDSDSLISASVIAELEQLVVVDRCTCGCDSVDFVQHGQSDGASIYADVIGITPKGGFVGVLVWGKDGRVTGLEVYDLGAGQDDVKLPVPRLIRSWEEGGLTPAAADRASPSGKHTVYRQS